MYPKIQTLFERDKKTFKIIPSIKNSDTVLALTYLTNLIVEEKIDGTNACIEYTNNAWGEFIDYYSRKNKIIDCSKCKIIYRGNLYETLLKVKQGIECSKCNSKGYKDIMFIRETLEKVINLDLLRKWYKENFKQDEDGASITVKIFGEVFGDKINNGIKYIGIKNYRDFRVFDIQIGNKWLNPKTRDLICKKIQLKSVPIVKTLVQFTPYESWYDMLFRTNSKSLVAKEYGQTCKLEGYIIRPSVSLYVNNGRVIGKIKRSDYEEEHNKTIKIGT